MKYINTYKLFESNSNSEDMLDEVEDMLLDLYDKDYKIQKSVQNNRNSYNWSVPSYKTQQFTDVESDEEVSAPQDYTHPLDNFSLFNIYIKNGWTSGDTRAARGALRGPR